MGYWSGFVDFTKKAFSDNGTPSSSRIVSGWLSVSSMALLWYIVKRMIYMPLDKTQVWVGGLPLIIGALTGFVIAPYSVNTVANGITKIFKKEDNVNVNVQENNQP